MVLLFVIGCHRSGTSLLASLLRDTIQHDVTPAQPDLPIALDNPRGFFESQKLQNLNDELLRSIDSAWDHPPVLPPNWSLKQRVDQFCALRSLFSKEALQTRWIDKDPRLCITYGAYAHILLRRVAIAAIIRDPLDVATSLYFRNAFPIKQGLAIWYLYNHHLAFHLQDGDQIWDYHRMLQLKHADQEIAAALISFNKSLEQVGCPSIDSDQFKRLIQKHIAPELNRSGSSAPESATWTTNESGLAKICKQAYANWQSSSNPIQAWKEEFGSIPFELSQLLSAERWYVKESLPDTIKYKEVIKEIKEKESKLERLCSEQRDKILQLEQKLTDIQESSSWRISKPLRWLGDCLKK